MVWGSGITRVGKACLLTDREAMTDVDHYSRRHPLSKLYLARERKRGLQSEINKEAHILRTWGYPMFDLLDVRDHNEKVSKKAYHCSMFLKYWEIPKHHSTEHV